MTRPRLYPDRPRTCAETRAWALAAKDAGASIWQIAVFTQHKPNTLYRVIARLRKARGDRKRRRPPGRSVRDVEQRQRRLARIAPAAMRYRCACCGGRATDPAGHPHCREAA